ncbi:MAG: ABC transporter permease [Gemmatimonadota bacterium]|nr:ABC transporter permease [Gemmatimonadota bacterium]
MLKNYVKIAFRMFWRHKFFTGVNLFGICITLVVLMFAVIIFDQEVGPIPPEIHADRTLYLRSIYVLQTSEQRSSTSSSGASYAFLDRYVRRLETAENATVFSRSPSYRNLRDGGEDASVEVRLTDGAYWQVFRFDFRQGRPYTDDEVESGDFVAVIKASFSKRFFGSEAVVGKSVPIDGENYRVVGVVADPIGGNTYSDVWVPVTTDPPKKWRSYAIVGNFAAAVLARQSADIEPIRAEFATVLEQVEPPPDARSARVEVAAPLLTKFEGWMLGVVGGLSARDFVTSGNKQQLVTVHVWQNMIVVGICLLLIMLLPALHHVNLNIGRIEERAAEIGVRRAFGGSVRTLMGQFVMENVLLTLIGGVLSLPCVWGVMVLSFHVYLDTGVLLRTFFYGLLMAVVFGAISGAYPAWKMARLNPVQALTGREN